MLLISNALLILARDNLVENSVLPLLDGADQQLADNILAAQTASGYKQFDAG